MSTQISGEGEIGKPILPDYLKNSYLRGAMILLSVLVCYIPAMRAGFIWDDSLHLIDNIILKENGLYRMWFTNEGHAYWVITWTSYWFEHLLWGLNPTGYHIVNVILHAGSSLLIWRVLLRLNIPGAWFAALVFAIHPVNVESAAWIAQRKNVLAMFFYAVTMLWCLRFDDTKERRWYFFAIVAFLLSMLSKGAAATMPVVWLLCAWWRRGTITRRDILLSLPFFAVTAVVSFLEIWFQFNRAIGKETVWEAGFFERLATSGRSVWFYIYKALLPFNLTFIYPREELDPTNWFSYVPGTMLVVLLLLSWWYRKGWGRPVFFALCYFVGMLAPVLGFIDFYFLKYSLVADHYQYFSIIGVIALVVGTATTLAGNNRERQQQLAYAGTALVLVLGALTWRQTTIYYDRETLWRDTIRKNPLCGVAYNNLGVHYHKQGRSNEAVSVFQQALDLMPANTMWLINLGRAYIAQSRFPEAIRCFEDALKHEPDDVPALENLADLLAKLERYDEAIPIYQRVIKLTPENALAHFNLAKAHQDVGEFEQAVESYRTSLKFDAESVLPRNNLGNCLRELGRLKEAAVQFETALKSNSDNSMLHHNYSIVLQELGQLAQAEKHLAIADQLDREARQRQIRGLIP